MLIQYMCVCVCAYDIRVLQYGYAYMYAVCILEKEGYNSCGLAIEILTSERWEQTFTCDVIRSTEPLRQCPSPNYLNPG